MIRKENNIVLFSVTLCWAASYVFIKSLPPDFSSYAYLTLTAGTASIVLLLMLHRYPTKNNLVGIPIMLFGLALTSGFELEGFMSEGAFYMIVSCLFMAVYTISADAFTKNTDPLLLGVIQMCFTAVIGFVLWFIEEPSTFASIDYTKELLSSIFILAFFAKAYVYIMLMYSQRYASPVSVTIIASTEPIVTLVLALLISASFGAREVFRMESLLGAVCIAIGAIVAGTDFLGRRKELTK